MSTAKMSHQTARALRTVHSSSVARAAAMESSFGMSSPTVDIFDAPVRLRQTPASQRPAKPLSPLSMQPRTPTERRTSLPDPLVFAGPAGRRPVLGTHHDLELALSHSPRHADASKLVVTMFDGPAYSGGRPRATLSGSSSSRGGDGANSAPPNKRKKLGPLALSAGAASAVTLAVANS
ncbi:hypothetical protein C8R47DRAFT_1161405 [Mycena vitilis]|nr:hypothetical protein C8R47DRAFT_1161405 [Mycena vitilis]